MPFTYWDHLPTPVENGRNPPQGAPEGMAPGDVNDVMRNTMAGLGESRVAWEQLMKAYPDPADPPILPPNLGENDGGDPANYYNIAYLDKPELQTFTGQIGIDGTAHAEPTLKLIGNDTAGPDIQWYDSVTDVGQTLGFNGAFVAADGNPQPHLVSTGWIDAKQPYRTITDFAAAGTLDATQFVNGTMLNLQNGYAAGEVTLDFTNAPQGHRIDCRTAGSGITVKIITGTDLGNANGWGDIRNAADGDIRIDTIGVYRMMSLMSAYPDTGSGASVICTGDGFFL